MLFFLNSEGLESVLDERAKYLLVNRKPAILRSTCQGEVHVPGRVSGRSFILPWKIAMEGASKGPLFYRLQVKHRETVAVYQGHLLPLSHC